MVIKKFSPSGEYRNGIIKNIYPTNESDEITLDCPNVDKNWNNIFPTAFLNDNNLCDLIICG